jgi:hypothetical protein
MAGRATGPTAFRDLQQVAPKMVWLCPEATTDSNNQTFSVSGDTASLLRQPMPLCTMATTAERWPLDGRDALGPGQLMAGVPKPAPPVASTSNPA